MQKPDRDIIFPQRDTPIWQTTACNLHYLNICHSIFRGM